VILSASDMALMSWLTRWSMGALEPTHGQLDGAEGRALAASAGPVRAAATALTAVSATAASVIARHRCRRGFAGYLALLPSFRIFPPRLNFSESAPHVNPRSRALPNTEAINGM
jgi:hypothetical protein